MKPRTYYLHVNKQKGCWTIHTSGQCVLAAEVTINVRAVTVHKPDKKDNPRFFIKCKGVLKTVDICTKTERFKYEINPE